MPGLGQQIGEQIAEELGRLPLALEQAAAWLDRSQMPAGEYLELLRSRAADLYARGQPGGCGVSHYPFCNDQTKEIPGPA